MNILKTIVRNYMRIFVKLLPNFLLKLAVDEYRLRYSKIMVQALNIDNEKANWSSADLVVRHLGIYEKHIKEIITKSDLCYENFIDIGAADGHYIDFVQNFLPDINIIAVEIDDERRRFLEKRRYKNTTVLKELTQEDLSVHVMDNSIILMDIEGGEYNYFDGMKQLLHARKNILIICELHNFKANVALIESFIDEVRQDDITAELVRRENITIPRELDSFPSDASMLLLSENREANARWLVLESH